MELGCSNNGEGSEMWDWQGEACGQQRYLRSDLTQFMWEGMRQNEDEDIFCILEEQTPIKDCTDVGYQSSSLKDEKTKVAEELRESFQHKGRRMLQFTSDINESFSTEQQMTSDLVSSELMECSTVGDGISECLQWNTQWALGFSDHSCSYAGDDLEQLSDGWLVECLNEEQIHCSPDEMCNNVILNQQADISDFCQNLPPPEDDMAQEKAPGPAPHRGLKSNRPCFIKSPRKSTSSVAYPFALIKPCGVQGVVTLSDINQRIHAPPPTSLKHKKDEIPATSYSTSAFSGKPVVVKTKIRTEGGQGSITIMRTKG